MSMGNYPDVKHVHAKRNSAPLQTQKRDRNNLNTILSATCRGLESCARNESGESVLALVCCVLWHGISYLGGTPLSITIRTSTGARFTWRL